ncbi:hypothetical protein GCM10017557_73560 [Streptomyces aurantiacus]|uniref:Uncharacterized protein n=1 Tax=Streptomyces aurantiacus TaxID=47760 RepID=A0A7G1PFJ0_9ACTN|nr:hypothetical protein GCM10017557_73560 [Streptomyces aurantiacus]
MNWPARTACPKQTAATVYISTAYTRPYNRLLRAPVAGADGTVFPSAASALMTGIPPLTK